MFKKVLNFFDKFEDKVRAALSRVPILYALVGAVGVILMWKGIWEAADYVPGLQGVGAIAAGVVILLATGLLVSFFIGDSIIMSGLKRDKKFVEKKVLEAEKSQTTEILSKLEHLEQDIHSLKKE